MKKRILSVLLSMVVATTISSAVPMSVQAETTADKSAVQSANTTTTYGSNTNPGEVATKDIKEWRDKANENDVYQVGIISKEKILDGRVSGYKHIMNRVLVTMF